MKGRGGCKTGLEEEETKRGRCGLEEKKGNDGFLGFNRFWLEFWMSKS